MTPSQLALAGLSRGPTTGRLSKKKLTKDQQIAALKEELRAAQEHASVVTCSVSFYFISVCLLRALVLQNHSAVRGDQAPQDTGGDTDPATDVEETSIAVVGTKRKTAGSTRSASTCALFFYLISILDCSLLG